MSDLPIFNCPATGNMLTVGAKSFADSYSDLPTILQTGLTDIVQGAAARIILYTYAPLVVISLVAIWLMVVFDKLDWKIALIATVVILVLAYVFFIAYRADITSFVSTQFSQLETNIINIINERFPTARNTALAAYLEEGKKACIPCDNQICGL